MPSLGSVIMHHDFVKATYHTCTYGPRRAKGPAFQATFTCFYVFLPFDRMSVAFELRHSSEDCKDHFPCGCARINLLAKRHELHPE